MGSMQRNVNLQNRGNVSNIQRDKKTFMKPKMVHTENPFYGMIAKPKNTSKKRRRMS